jgi:ribonuclease HII
MIIAGSDEVGRGPLAGPVVAAAVILPENYDLPGLTDSKKLSEKKRDILFELIKGQAISWCVAEASVEEIDDINILQASLLAMKRAIEGLAIQPDKALVDGNRCPQMAITVQAIIGGDFTIPSISAASIIAKVTRDRHMVELDKLYPEYGLASHKGYGTKLHMQAIAKYGPRPIHRKSFAPIKKLLEA